MTLLRMDSCSQNSYANNQGQWAVFSPESANWSWLGLENHHFGNDRLAMAADLGTDDHATIVMGARLGIAEGGYDTMFDDSWFRFEGSGVRHVSVTGDLNGVIKAFRGPVDTGTLLGSSSTYSYPTYGWWYLEAKVVLHDTTGSVEVRVNGNTVLNLTNQDTKNGGAGSTIDWVGYGAAESKNMSGRDLYVLNGAGSAPHNDFLGPVRIDSFRPNGNGNYSDFTGSDGNQVDNYLLVDEHDLDSDSTYVEASAAGRDSYAVENVTGDPIAVKVMPVARYNTAPLDLAAFLRRSSTDDDGTAATPTGTYLDVGTTIWETDPIAAGAWTEANFNATEFGVKAV